MQVPCRAPSRPSCDIHYHSCCCGQVGGSLRTQRAPGRGDTWNADPGGRARGELEGAGGQSPWGSLVGFSPPPVWHPWAVLSPLWVLQGAVHGDWGESHLLASGQAPGVLVAVQ